MFKKFITLLFLAYTWNACADFTLPPLTISNVPPNPGDRLHVVVDTQGNALATWSVNTPTIPSPPPSTLNFATLPSKGTAWSTPGSIIPPTSDHIINLLTVSDQAGNAIAVWLQSSGSTFSLQGARYSPTSNTWTPTANLPTVSDFSSVMALTVSANGDAILLYSTQNGPNFDINGLKLPAGSTSWENPWPTIATSPYFINIATISLAMDAAGRAVMVWVAQNTPNANIHAAILTGPAPGTWSNTQDLPTYIYLNNINPQVSISAGGYAVSVWEADNTPGNVIEGATLDLNTVGDSQASWTLTDPLSILDMNHRPLIASDRRGNAIAIWQNDTYGLQGATLPFGSKIWKSDGNIDPKHAARVGSSYQLAVNEFGNAIASWVYLPGGVFGSYKQLGYSWRGSTQLGNFVSNGLALTDAAIDTDGNGVVVWSDSADDTSGTFSLIQSSQYFIPAPPSNLVAKPASNVFLNETECATRLKWSPSTDPTTKGYRLYRNGILIHTFLATGPFEFTDRKRCCRCDIDYALVSFNLAGAESIPIFATLKTLKK